MVDVINTFFNKNFNQNCFTNVYGLSRSCLAFGTLSTFIFSSPKILFDKVLFNVNNSGDLIDKLNIFYLFGYDNLYFSYTLSILILLAVISGIYPRFTGILHWIITFSFQYASAIPDGGDQIAMILSLYFVPITVMDNRKNHFYTSIYQTSFQNSVSCLVTKFLIPLQMSIIYFHSAIEKLYKLEEWRNGTALYYILEDPLFGSSFFKKQIMNLFSSKYIVVPLTWGTVLIEILLFSALFMNYKNKKILFFIGTIFHFSIILFFGLFSFFFSMFSGLIVYLLNPSDNFRFFNFKKLPLIKSISKYKLNL